MMAAIAQISTSDKLRLPYSLTNTPWLHNPAAASEDAIFYAVNPYWQLYKGFIKWCNDPTNQGLLQLVPISSFAPITLWRVYPYVYCPPSQAAGCYDGLSAAVVVPDSGRPIMDASECSVARNFVVTSMDYIDAENIAVSVLRGPPSNIDPDTLQPIDASEGNTTTVTYFLNTVTMQLREGVAWVTEVPQSVYTQGQLCPAQRRMPQIGSMGTEIIVASVFFIKMPLHVVLNGVYIFDRWTKERGDEMPLITRGHSLLLSASSTQAFSLKDFFDSADRVNHLFWRTLAIIARGFANKPGGPMAITFLNGVKVLGEATINPLAPNILGYQVLGGLKIPMTQDEGMKLWQSVMRTPGWMSAYTVLANPTNIADFSYHFVVDLVYRIVRSSFTGKSPETVFYTTMYDFEQQFNALITASMHKACTGMSLTMGYTNPWALMVRHQCDSWAAVPGGLLAFLNTFLVDVPTAKCLCKDSQVLTSSPSSVLFIL